MASRASLYYLDALPGTYEQARASTRGLSLLLTLSKRKMLERGDGCVVRKLVLAVAGRSLVEKRRIVLLVPQPDGFVSHPSKVNNTYTDYLTCSYWPLVNEMLVCL